MKVILDIVCIFFKITLNCHIELTHNSISLYPTFLLSVNFPVLCFRGRLSRQSTVKSVTHNGDLRPPQFD